MEVVDRKPIPVYEVTCCECGSTIEYTRAETINCHIYCPICNTFLWAVPTVPKRYKDSNETEDVSTVDAVEVVRCKDCKRFEPSDRNNEYGNCSYHLSLAYSTDFCSWGLRIDE